MIAGMKNTWTPTHVDDGGDSTWSMSVEGHKLLIFCRPEQRTAFTAYFNRSISWQQWTPADRKFLVVNKCIMVYQRPGTSSMSMGGPHMVKHLTDSLSINSSVLNSWNAVAAFATYDFDKWTREEWSMFTAAYEGPLLRASALELTHTNVTKLTEVWKRKRDEAEEAREKRRRLK